MKYGTLAAVALCLSFSVPSMAQERGCTDPRAQNHQPEAAINDGSCRYAKTTVTPDFTTELPLTVSGSSGLFFWEGNLYTHNDHYEAGLYRLDTAEGLLLEHVPLPGRFRDMEDAASDSLYIYLGDFGNNASGNRNDLRILRILKASLHDSLPQADTITFTYPEQTDSLPAAANSTDWDCEAMIAVGDSLYLFTKQWKSRQTMQYALPKRPGRHDARLVDSFAVGGLVTGADYDEENRVVVLCGYSTLLQPFILLLYDYGGNRFFSGNKRKIALKLPFHQVEAVAGAGSYIYYLTNEEFRRNGFSTPARLHRIDLSTFLSAEQQK